MAKDRSNAGSQSISVKRQRGGQVSMALPRSDDGMVHKASGKRDNTSAAHHADAMDRVVGGPSGAAREFAQGD